MFSKRVTLECKILIERKTIRNQIKRSTHSSLHEHKKLSRKLVFWGVKLPADNHLRGMWCRHWDLKKKER